MGLLDDPLMNFGVGLLNAGGPSRFPVSLGQGMAQGVQQAQQAEAMQRQKDAEALRMQLLQMQMAQQKTAQEEAIKKRAALDGYLQNVPEQLRPLAGAFPEETGKAMLGGLFKTPEKPQLVTVAGPNGEPMQKWIRPGEARGIDVGQAPNKESALPWYVKKGPDGRMAIDPAFAEFEKSKAASGRPVTPFYQAVPTAEGLMTFDARKGTFAPAMSGGGAPLVKSTDSPELQGRIAGAKEFSKTQAEDQAKAQGDYPRVVQNAETALRHADELMKHPGFSTAVGKSSMLGIQKIPGTDAKGFINRLDQIKGGAFLEAFNSLKGGGQITEIEGKKATDAIARMDNATSEDDFKAAVKDYTDVVRAGMNRAKMKARPVSTPAPQGGGNDDPLGLRK